MVLQVKTPMSANYTGIGVIMAPSKPLFLLMVMAWGVA